MAARTAERGNFSRAKDLERVQPHAANQVFLVSEVAAPEAGVQGTEIATQCYVP